MNLTSIRILDFLEKHQEQYCGINTIKNNIQRGTQTRTIIYSLKRLCQEGYTKCELVNFEAVYTFVKKYDKEIENYYTRPSIPRYSSCGLIKLSSHQLTRYRQEKIIAFFKANPGKKYTINDVNYRAFDNKIDYQRVRFYLEGLLGFGFLQRNKNGNRWEYYLLSSK